MQTVVCPSVYTPYLRAASAESGLMVEADMYWPAIARLIMGYPLSSLESAAHASLETPPMKTDGSKTGALAMPRISPFVTSMQTQAPFFASAYPWLCPALMAWARPSSHACWILRSSVSLMSLPGSGGTEDVEPVTLP